MKVTIKVAIAITVYVLFVGVIYAQNISELRKFTDEDWIKMTTAERLKALNVSMNHPGNQTFMGDFGGYYDLYPRWGYDYYEMEDRYETYAFRGFENYNIMEDRRSKWYYNQFGDRLTKMTRSARIWAETYYDAGATDVKGPTGYINRYRGGSSGSDGIWVVQESTNDWAISVVGADALRTKFTSLTLTIPNLSGMKADFQSANYEASIVNSIVSGGGGRYGSVRGNTLLLRGGQFRRKFGTLTLGVNYVNMYARQVNREKGDIWKGTVSDNTPTPMLYAVRIMDDSPHDGSGPIIHDVKIKVDGVYRPDILPQIIIDDYRRELTTAITSTGQIGYLDFNTNLGGERQNTDFTQLSLFERIPKFLDYMLLNDYVHGWNVKDINENLNYELGFEFYKYMNPGGKPFQVNGNEYVVYLFDLSSIKNIVKRVQVEITVSNDYRIQLAEIFTKKQVGGHSPRGDYFNWYNTSFWKTMAQAEGNIKDNSNLRTVTVDFAWEVGNTIYGFDAHFNYLGLKVDGEYVRNIHHYMFSDGIPGTGDYMIDPTDISPRYGHHSSLSDKAYYIILQKDWRLWGVAGEYFKMGKFYRPYMDYQSGSYSQNYFSRISLVEDNDDDDQYPDMGTSDPDGVYPGNDFDHDGIPDNEKNLNRIPDYNEPFLIFDVDPDEFVFGDDFNNNNIPDFREDDMKYDTPYDLDRQGHHFNMRFTPQKNIDILAGTLRTRGVGLDTRTNDDYFKVKINYDVFNIGNIYGEYRYHEIQDNVQDSYVVVSTSSYHVATYQRGTSGFNRQFYYDEREYRNSTVNKFFLESKVRAFPSITIENHVKYERNSQLEGTMYDNTFQEKDILTTFAMVNKFVYTKQWGNWIFSPGVKFRLYKKERSESLNPLDHYMMRIPLVYFKYRISPRTNITLGLQGFKGFELLYRDYIQSYNNYRQINYILEVSNRTTYFGFDVWGGFGFKLEQVMFEEKLRGFEKYKSSMLFVQMWLGY